MRRAFGLAGALAAVVIAAGCNSGGEGSARATETTAASAPSAAAPARVDLSGVKDYLLEHTALLTDFTEDFAANAHAYYDLAETAGFDYGQLVTDPRAGQLVVRMKDNWVKGNPYYEQMEGIVAGTPSLSEYDVIIDAGSSAAEDPASAVAFDLTLPDGRVVKQPGNFYNITEGALWGTLPDALGVSSTPVDLDGDGAKEFGEVLPDAAFLLAATQDFVKYAKELETEAQAWAPSESDAFTALVVMVPTMSEYFGQWKVSRFVKGNAATGEAFNVVSRLSDINDILTSLMVIYAGVQPLVSSVDKAQANQTREELEGMKSFIDDLYEQEQSGRRFTPEEADTLGSEAQERGTAVAGQVSQAAAQLGIEIEQ